MTIHNTRKAASDRDAPELRLAHCWAHVKRKFDEASEHYPQACSEVLRLIGELYEVERLVPGPFPGDEEAQNCSSKSEGGADEEGTSTPRTGATSIPRPTNLKGLPDHSTPFFLPSDVR